MKYTLYKPNWSTIPCSAILYIKENILFILYFNKPYATYMFIYYYFKLINLYTPIYVITIIAMPYN